MEIVMTQPEEIPGLQKYYEQIFKRPKEIGKKKYPISGLTNPSNKIEYYSVFMN